MTLAGDLYKKGRENDTEFAIAASYVVGSQPKGLPNQGTKDLAAEISRSVDTVEQYALTGREYRTLLDRWPSHAEILRADLSFPFWHSTRDVFAKLGAQEAYNCLSNVLGTDMTVEDYRKQLPKTTEEPNPLTVGVKKLTSLWQHICSLAESSKITAEQEKQVNDAAKKVHDALYAVTALEELLRGK